MSELEKICSLLDKFTLEAFLVMEQHIQLKINLENSMCDGEAHLAKSRYIMGLKNVSALQLPPEDGPEITALARVHSAESEKLFGQKMFDLEIRKKPSNDEESESYQDPLRWFGVLVPQDLHRAQAKYRQALMWCIQSANVQTKLRETCIKIEQLRKYKAELVKCEE